MPEFRHRISLVGCCLAVCAIFFLAAPGVAVPKPLPPVDVTWDRQQEDGRFRLTLTVHARIPLSHAEITVTPEQGVMLDGERRWQGELAADQRHTMVFWTALDARGAVTGVVDAATALNVHFSAGTTVYVPTDPPIRQRPRRSAVPGDPPRQGVGR